MVCAISPSRYREMRGRSAPRPSDDSNRVKPDDCKALVGVTLAMSDKCFELDANEAAAIFSAFAQARAAGHPFDAFTVALVEVLHRQLTETDEGFEDDVCVSNFENDDPDEDTDGDECEDSEFSSLEPSTSPAFALMKARVA